MEGGGGGPPRRQTTAGGGDSSSSDEEEDAKWKAAIADIASTTTFGMKVFGDSTSQNAEDGNGDNNRNPQKLKHYQIKAQKLLDDMLERTLEIVKDTGPDANNDAINAGHTDNAGNASGVRLFKHSSVGIVFDHVDEIRGPKKKPRIFPGKDETSKKLKQKIKSVAVEGTDIIAAAKAKAEKALARLEAKESAAKEKAKKEEERVHELKKIRGERWLPSIAREMQLNKGSGQ